MIQPTSKGEGWDADAVKKLMKGEPQQLGCSEDNPTGENNG